MFYYFSLLNSLEKSKNNSCMAELVYHRMIILRYLNHDSFLACIKGSYGKDCAFVCKGRCKNGCNHVNGKCDNGCVPGWHTVDCSKG